LSHRVVVGYLVSLAFFFLFLAPPPSYLYTLSLHDALPIFFYFCTFLFLHVGARHAAGYPDPGIARGPSLRSRDRTADAAQADSRDRKSTRLNSSHSQISYAVFCLKKKKKSPFPART